MSLKKAHDVVEALMRSGFDMTTKEFYRTTVYRILKKYGIDEQLPPKEYYELMKLLLDKCAENDLKNMGDGFCDSDDWMDK